VPDGELDALLDRIPVLQGVRREVTDLDGGLTNRNVRVTTPDHDLVVRVFRGDAEQLGIDRDAEHHNSLAAAAAGVGAPVIDYRPDLGVLVIGYLQGTTLENASFGDPAVVARAADACHRLHAGPRFSGDFDMFRRQATYRRTVEEHGYRLFTGYDEHAEAWRRVQAALAVRAGATVPCNNDLLARVRLQSLVSEYGWSLWGAIQAGASSIDFDFTAWGQERFDKAARTFTSPTFDRLLEEVVRDD
jgi:hypothetical protein